MKLIIMLVIRILNKEDVAKIITMPEVIEVVESVYKAKSCSDLENCLIPSTHD